MFDKTQYQLIDFGGQEKIERFAGVTVVRHSPVASGQLANSNDVGSGLRFSPDITDELAKGTWSNMDQVPENWTIQHDGKVLRLRPTPFGHLGVFPEQASNWNWIQSLPIELNHLRALNLFAYTGGTTMALAKRGCQVTHIDSAQNVVNWARENAANSGLEDAPIRWIAEDVIRFIKRELKRGKRYDIVVADPPSFGRGPKNETWKMERDFESLLDGIFQLTDGSPAACLISCHTIGFEHTRLREHFEAKFECNELKLTDFPMTLNSQSKMVLPAGHCLRVFRPSS